MNSSVIKVVEDSLAAFAKDAPLMLPQTEEIAGRLAHGGSLFLSGSPGLVSEFSRRAGGLMMVQILKAGSLPGAGDVVMEFLQQDQTCVSPPSGGPSLKIGIDAFPGRPDSLKVSFSAKFAGISSPLATSAAGWIFFGELIAALTRLGRMPVIYQSVGMYDGWPRIHKYGTGKISFHDKHGVPPVEPCLLAGRYAGAVKGMLERFQERERRKLDILGEWLREAGTAGKRRFMYGMGHLVPYEVESPEMKKFFETGKWNAGFNNPQGADDAFVSGDLLVHIGYQLPPATLLEKLKKAGARAAYLSLHCDRDFADDPEVLWFDPMWPWSDACIPLDGYDIPILASSGVVNSAIAWEIRRML